MLYTCEYNSPLGKIIIEADNSAICKINFCESSPSNSAQTPLLSRACEWLDAYFSGAKPTFDLPLNPSGTPFQLRVWQILQTIPYGQTVTYGYIANVLAKERGLCKMSAQAVGGAVGSNPIAIVIPCHRVIGAHGNLTGYAAGINRKVALLKLEKSYQTDFHLPSQKSN